MSKLSDMWDNMWDNLKNRFGGDVGSNNIYSEEDEQEKERNFFGKIGHNLWKATQWIFSAMATAVLETAKFFGRHWKLTLAIAIAVLAAAVVTALLILFFPGTIAVLSAFTVSLPLFGAIAPFAFLGAMNIFGACALVGALAAPATLITVGLWNVGHWIHNKLHELFTPKVTLFQEHFDAADKLFKDQFSALSPEQHDAFIADLARQNVGSKSKEDETEEEGHGHFDAPKEEEIIEELQEEVKGLGARKEQSVRFERVPTASTAVPYGRNHLFGGGLPKPEVFAAMSKASAAAPGYRS